MSASTISLTSETSDAEVGFQPSSCKYKSSAYSDKSKTAQFVAKNVLPSQLWTGRHGANQLLLDGSTFCLQQQQSDLPDLL
jgi:hypothetical protein